MPKPSPQRRSLLKNLAFCLAAPLDRAAMAQAPASSTPPLSLGQSISWSTITALTGEVLPASHFEGRVTVIYWWASWCPFCREQTPEMQKLWIQHSPRSLRLLGISVDTKLEVAQQHQTRAGMTFPSTWSTEGLMRIFPRPRGVPVTAVIDRRGLVVQIERGQMFPEDIASLARWL